MKKILIIQLLLCLCLSASAQKALFNKYSDAKGVTSVYISKAMLSLAGNFKAGKSDISKIASRLDHLQILTFERPSMIRTVRKEAVEAFRKEGFEQIMQVKDDGDNVTIYLKTHKNKKNEFVLFNVGEDELEIINVLGNVTLKEIKELTE